MTPTIDEIREWDFDALGTAGQLATSNASEIDAAADAAVRAMDVSRAWTGQTHDAAETRIRQEQDHASEIRNVLNHIADEAADAVDGLGYACDWVITQADQATRQGFDVAPDGSVEHPDADRSEEADGIEATLKSGLATVAELDQAHGAALRAFVADLQSMIDGQPDLVVAGIGSIDPDALVGRIADMTPDERAALFADLTPEQIRSLVQADPHVLGNTDGVPFDVRASANEVNIRNALIDELQRQPPDQARVERLEAMLTPIEDPIGTRDGTQPDLKIERTFLAFDSAGNGQMIEIVGGLGPDTENVAVYVPGTGTNLNGSQGNHNSAWNLARQSGSPVILYMDGHFPQNLGEAALTGPAKDMAPRLVSFGSELDRTIAGISPDAETTFIGHSYGGSIVGTAEQMSLNADRIVHASSAGTGVIDGQEWSNPNDDVRRYSLTAPGDPIWLSQGFPDQHGGDPDNAPGVKRVDTGFYSDGTLVEGLAGHGNYWNDPGSDAFQNMAKIVRGEEPPGFVWRKPDMPFVGGLFPDPSPPVILAPGPFEQVVPIR